MSKLETESLSSPTLPETLKLKPLLTRMSQASLKERLNSNLKYILASLESFSNLESREFQNTRRNQLHEQLLDTFDVFSPHVEIDYFLKRLIDCGQQIQSMHGLQDIALKCYTKFNQISLQNQCTDLVLITKCKNGMLMCAFLNLRSSDPYFKSSATISKLLEILDGFIALIDSCTDKIVAKCMFDSTWNIYNICTDMTTYGLHKQVFIFNLVYSLSFRLIGCVN